MVEPILALHPVQTMVKLFDSFSSNCMHIHNSIEEIDNEVEF